MQLSLDMISRAQHRLRGLVHRTPLVHSATLSAISALRHISSSNASKDCSFKPRGRSIACWSFRRRNESAAWSRSAAAIMLRESRTRRSSSASRHDLHAGEHAAQLS